MPDPQRTGAPGLEKEKAEVQRFWDAAPCGEAYARGESPAQGLEVQRSTRYQLEPYIPGFARFDDGAGRDVLEIGVGMGVDHLEWARAKPRSLTGIDFSSRALQYTRLRLRFSGVTWNLSLADAEYLPFRDESFDIVYSWGVLHHTPDTPAAVREVYRVLRPNGIVRAMIYHKRSIVGLMLWIKYALLAGRPGRTLADVYANHLESPGTKAYSQDEARRLFASFSTCASRSRLCIGDLLVGEVGQRHRGAVLSIAKKLWPRWLVRRLFPQSGLYLLIEARK